MWYYEWNKNGEKIVDNANKEYRLNATSNYPRTTFDITMHNDIDIKILKNQIEKIWF